MDDGRSHPLWLSAVVLSELFIGASDRKARRQLMQTEQAFTKVHRILVPLQRDWSVAGQVLDPQTFYVKPHICGATRRRFTPYKLSAQTTP